MKLHPFLLASALAAGLAVPSAFAQAVWDGGGANNNWTTGLNWGGSAPSSGTSLDFGGTTRTSPSNDNAGQFTAATIRILSSATDGFAIAGNNLITTTFVMQSGAGNSSISNQVRTTAMGGYSFDLATGTQLTYSGAITNLAGAGQPNRNLTLTGGGTLVLTNTSNTFSNDSATSGGNVQIDNGTLRVNSAIGNYGANGPLGQMNGTLSPGIRLGAGTTSGTLEYAGPAGSSNRRFRLGDGAAGTSTGGGSILNNGTGTLTLTRVTLLVADSTATAARTFTLGGSNNGVIQGTIADNNTPGGGTIGIAKSGAGTWTLQASNTYTGGTVVSAGTLLVNNTFGSGTGTGAVTVDSGGTLGGNGTISGSTTINGTHNPGNSPGLQTFGGNLTYNNGSSINWELTGNTVAGRGTSFDGINVGSNLTINSTSTINLVFNATGSAVDWNDAFWGSDRSWTFYDVAGSTTGAFTLGSIGLDSLGQSLGSVRSLASFSIGYSGSDVLINYAAIPEPSTWALLAISLTALLIFRRRRSC